MIAEIQCLPTPAGTADNPHGHVEAAIAVIQNSGLHYEVGPLGTTLEGDADAVWATVRAAHEAGLAAGADSVLSAVKFADVGSMSMERLTRKFR
ncbi:MAG: thiamine-binding protein [Mycobacteriales bacterium]